MYKGKLQLEKGVKCVKSKLEEQGVCTCVPNNEQRY